MDQWFIYANVRVAPGKGKKKTGDKDSKQNHPYNSGSGADENVYNKNEEASN